jgi:hypothetical protein
MKCPHCAPARHPAKPPTPRADRTHRPDCADRTHHSPRRPNPPDCADRTHPPRFAPTEPTAPDRADPTRHPPLPARDHRPSNKTTGAVVECEWRAPDLPAAAGGTAS